MNKKRPNTCVSPEGTFIVGLHEPNYIVTNVRSTNQREKIGYSEVNEPIYNDSNFAIGDINCTNIQGVYEVLNAFPIWGATYILKKPADYYAEDIRTWQFDFEKHTDVSNESDFLTDIVNGSVANSAGKAYAISDLPQSLLIALAQTSDNPDILVKLANIACELVHDNEHNGNIEGIRFKKVQNNAFIPIIHNHELFEVVVNNPALPDEYKLAMVLMPGAQGTSPIVGEYRDGKTHIWEYLRANSYIPWGHFASNMAQDSIRYSAKELTLQDLMGLRHLYYQRVMLVMAQELKIEYQQRKEDISLCPEHIEELRKNIIVKLDDQNILQNLNYTGTIWGWNYGFDYSPSGYRLNASHQQIHQQFALSRSQINNIDRSLSPTYIIGDRIAEFIECYHQNYHVDFFDMLLKAIYSNNRIDKRTDRPQSLIVYEDDNVVLYVPKAQRTQGELQLITKQPVGNVLEADLSMRNSLDKGIFLAIKALYHIGASMITSYEVSKRFDESNLKQHLFYCFLPKHPQSPGAFSEAQGRWITGHFPEDYADVMRNALCSIELI